MEVVLFKDVDDLMNASQTFREKKEKVITLKVLVEGKEYTLSEYNGKLEVRILNGELIVHPQAQNMIYLSLGKY